MLAVVLVGCQATSQSATQPSTESAVTQAEEAAEDTDTIATASPQEAQELEGSETISETTSQSGTTTAITDANTESENGEELSTFSPPMRLAIPSLDFAVDVEPMAWQVTEVDGQRQAVWEVPQDKAGWHINSAAVGAADNMIISGHHRQGAAVFALLARGEVVLSDEIYVTDEQGRTYIYQVTEVGAPIPVAGATEAEQERLAGYQAPATEGALTLLTGWPDFSDTHYLAVVAKLIGELE